MEVLITGARGFIGNETAISLEENGFNVSSFKGDVQKKEDWIKNLKGSEIIILIAGIRTESNKDFDVNSVSIETLLQTAEKTKKLPKKIVLASSQAVYMGNETPFKETDEPNPTTIYGESKLKGEIFATELCSELGIPLVILRYSTVLGPGVKEKSRMSGPLALWTRLAVKNEPIKINQDGNQTRDYIHISEVSKANLIAIDLPDGVYNVGGGKPVKLIDLAQWILEYTKSSSEIIIAGNEPSREDPKEMFSDTSKIRSFGWKVLKDAQTAVEEFVNAEKNE